MRHREPPRPVVSRQEWRERKRDPRVKHWLRQYAGDPTITQGGVDPELLSFVIEEVLGNDRAPYLRKCFDKAMAATTPVLAVPKPEGIVDALTHVTK